MTSHSTPIQLVFPSYREYLSRPAPGSVIRKDAKSLLAVFQGLFYFFSGLWPVVHMKSFEKVTGPKTDQWLVKTVGLLISVSGLALLRSGTNAKVSTEAMITGMGQSFSLGCISLYYSLRKRISKIYLLDAAVEYAFVGLWYFVSRPR